MSKIVVILGPTSSGKTSLAVRLAHKFNGEIVSADSRQVYRGMDVGTGKDLKEYEIKVKSPESKSQKTVKIPHHLIDVADPKKYFDLAKYQKLANKAIEDILKRGKLPIIAGGTGLYLQALIDGYNLPEVKPDKKLRRDLEKKSADQLFYLLKKLNPKFAEKINQSDRKNKRRLIRYIEISKLPKNSEPSRAQHGGTAEGKPSSIRAYKFLTLGIKVSKEILDERIEKRLYDRLEKEGMVFEVESLRRDGVSWKRLENFGLEYKHIALYLEDKLEYDEMTERLFQAIKKYARKQTTWFRRWERQGRKIKWIEECEEAESAVTKFLET
ncbi:MAG: tRNA (adenosine(37)-N6)-dimethylallyltransferase MiaA [Patescibacteria group bacterium]|jgi:tRNA dimethylallyltransferase